MSLKQMSDYSSGLPKGLISNYFRDDKNIDPVDIAEQKIVKALTVRQRFFN
jgi:hypothetical protein